MHLVCAFCLTLGPLAASRQSGNTQDLLEKKSPELPQAGWQPAVPGRGIATGRLAAGGPRMEPSLWRWRTACAESTCAWDHHHLPEHHDQR